MFGTAATVEGAVYQETAAATTQLTQVGTHGYRSPRHHTRIEPSFLESNVDSARHFIKLKLMLNPRLLS